MAMPYPEGEVFFKRSALKIPAGKGKNPWSFDANDPRDFARHILVEYIYNRSCYCSYPRAYPVYSEASGTKYFHPSSFNIMFSKSLQRQEDESPNSPRGIDLEHAVEIETLDDGAAYRDQAHGGPDKVTIMPVPITSSDDKFLFIDLYAPVRAVYLPLAQRVDNSLDPDLCTYIMVDFRFRKGVEMWYEGGISPDEEKKRAAEAAKEGQAPGGVLGGAIELGQVLTKDLLDGVQKKILQQRRDELEARRRGEKPPPPAEEPHEVRDTHPMHQHQSFSYKEGLGLQPRRTLMIDMQAAYNLLILPRHLRSPEKGLYKPADPFDSIVRNLDQSFTTPSNRGHMVIKRDLQILDYAAVISDHFGVDVTWQPYEYKESTQSLVTQLFTTGVEIGLNFIPIIGPIASAGFSVFMEAINDPDEFAKTNILELGPDVSDTVVASAKKIAKNLPKGKGGLKTIKLVTSA